MKSILFILSLFVLFNSEASSAVFTYSGDWYTEIATYNNINLDSLQSMKG